MKTALRLILMMGICVISPLILLALVSSVRVDPLTGWYASPSATDEIDYSTASAPCQTI